jgi:hypothetical protein
MAFRLDSCFPADRGAGTAGDLAFCTHSWRRVRCSSINNGNNGNSFYNNNRNNNRKVKITAGGPQQQGTRKAAVLNCAHRGRPARA